MLKMVDKKDIYISFQDIKQLSVLQSWKTILIIVLEWMIIFSCICIHILFSNFIVYILVWFVIATRLYALYSLIHDAIHYSITRNKMWNDIIAQIFLGFPLLISLKKMRKIHLAHHKYLQTDDDPEMKHLQYKEFQFPNTKWQLFKLFILDISGINFLKYNVFKIIQLILHFNIKNILAITDIILIGALFLIAYFIGIENELFFYWLLPYATVYQLLNRIRLSTEHFNIHESNEYKTRTVIPSLLERCILTPYNLGYHIEHHLFPGVPFYNLSKLHSLLKKNNDYNSNAIIYKSYSKVIIDFVK